MSTARTRHYNRLEITHYKTNTFVCKFIGEREALSLALCFTTHMDVYIEPTPHSTIHEALAENTGNLYTALKRNNYIARSKWIAGRHFSSNTK